MEDEQPAWHRRQGSTLHPWSAGPALRFEGPLRAVNTPKNRCSCFAEPLMAVSAAPGRPPRVLWAISRSRCRSSVVEHPLGKGEVVSSILTGSTIDRHGSSSLSRHHGAFRQAGGTTKLTSELNR